MQPSTASGRKWRFTLMPISWIVALFVIFVVFWLTAVASSTDMRIMLHSGAMQPLVVALPALFFGKVLGLMVMNLVAYCIPTIRRTFELECSEIGRHSFTKSMSDLSKIAFVAGILTLLGSTVFIWTQ